MDQIQQDVVQRSREVAALCHGFMTDCARSIELCAETPEMLEIAQQLRAQIKNSQPKDFKPNPLPALSNLSLVKDMALAKRFQTFALDLPWDYSPRTDDEGHELAVCDFSKVLAISEHTRTETTKSDLHFGVIYVDCHRQYPTHRHPPQELYFLISGTALWRYGDVEAHRSLTAGNLIHNKPNDLHGVIAGHTPVLALYVQWS